LTRAKAFRRVAQRRFAGRAHAHGACARS
jgi:hypothetical protein